MTGRTVVSIAATSAATVGRGAWRVLPTPVTRAAADAAGAAATAARQAADRLVRLVGPAIVRAVVDELDLTELVRERVDLDAIAADIDIDRILERVDVDGIVARADLDPVIGRLDLIGLAYYVVDGIDLPGIIRQSSGSMASEVVRGVRLQGMEADDAVGRLVGRFLPGRRTPPGQRAQPSTS